MKTPSQLLQYGVPELVPSRKIWRAIWAYRKENGDKPQFLSTALTMYASGAIAQFGDPGGNSDRITQKDQSAMQGITRSTLTKRISRWSAPERCPKCNRAKIELAGPDLLRCAECKAEFPPRWTQAKRRQASQRMSDIAANHPHWNRGGDKNEAVPVQSGAVPVRELPAEEIGGQGVLDNRTSPHLAANATGDELKSFKRCIITRNKAFGAPNSYALAMPDKERPGLKSNADPCAHAKILAAHFGDDMFDPAAEVNGFRKDWGWVSSAKIPNAPDCVCRKQKSFEFQEQCSKCQGRGYVIDGTMTDNARTILRWMNDRGIDQEIRRCEGCKRNYSQDSAPAWPKCPGCGDPGHVIKARGILQGWTQRRIAEVNGMHVSTVCSIFRVFRRHGLVRTVMGAIKLRKCCGKLYEDPQCPKCGNKCGQIKSRYPWKIIWLPSRTFDKELVAAEKQRLDALIRWHRRFLDPVQLTQLQAAVAAAFNVLAEWAGKEHQLLSFYHEMRRRLNTLEYSRYLNVLFPVNTS